MGNRKSDLFSFPEKTLIFVRGGSPSTGDGSIMCLMALCVLKIGPSCPSRYFMVSWFELLRFCSSLQF